MYTCHFGTQLCLICHKYECWFSLWVWKKSVNCVPTEQKETFIWLSIFEHIIIRSKTSSKLRKVNLTLSKNFEIQKRSCKNTNLYHKMTVWYPCDVCGTQCMMQADLGRHRIPYHEFGIRLHEEIWIMYLEIIIKLSST